MKAQKKLNFILQIGTIVSFIFLLMIHFLPPIPCHIPLITGNEEFWENVFQGLFSGSFIGYLSNTILLRQEQMKICLQLLRKVKFIESSINYFFNEADAYIGANIRYDNIIKNLNESIKNGDEYLSKKYTNDLNFEKENRKLLKIKLQNLLMQWDSISNKACDTKEDYNFKDICTKKNVDEVNVAINSLFNLQKRAINIKSIIQSGQVPRLAAEQMSECQTDIDTCLVAIIEACFQRQKMQETLKKIYVKEYCSKNTK